MRAFGPSVNQELEGKIRQATRELFEAIPAKRVVLGGELVMDNPDEIVAHEAKLKLSEGQSVEIAVTEPSARPPFDWTMEITSRLGESDYIKHYLIRDHDIVLAQRKVLTPIDDAEAEIILADLAAAKSAL